MAAVRRDKLNSAYDLAAVSDSPEVASGAGLDCSVDAVEKLIGAPITGSVVLDVVAVRDIVDVLWSGELRLDATDAADFPALSQGCQTVDGA